MTSSRSAKAVVSYVFRDTQIATYRYFIYQSIVLFQLPCSPFLFYYGVKCNNLRGMLSNFFYSSKFVSVTNIVPNLASVFPKGNEKNPVSRCQISENS